ncbi:hypothetical protein EJB05_43633 [Eragrostis curvula]|uniref:Uncharacterized protein n=1 Tax=Eragrostis curvula TaxID=38414 RepID=A0A5J9TFS2_9POAL|nr:hypothetical protein EJB05_43633 [Eragrostis curvula]
MSESDNDERTKELNTQATSARVAKKKATSGGLKDLKSVPKVAGAKKVKEPKLAASHEDNYKGGGNACGILESDCDRGFCPTGESIEVENLRPYDCKISDREIHPKEMNQLHDVKEKVPGFLKVIRVWGMWGLWIRIMQSHGIVHDYGIDEEAARRSASLHYNGDMKLWLELGIPAYKEVMEEVL